MPMPKVLLGSRASARLSPWLLTVLLVALVALVYQATSRNGFVTAWDDRSYIVGNPFVTGGLSVRHFVWAWTNFTIGSIWAPGTWLSMQLDWTLQLTPGDIHIEDAGLHALSAVLLFWLMFRLSGRVALAFACASIWACHPVLTGSVCWATERKNTLSMVFFLAALLAYSWPTRKAGVVAALLGALAFICKPSTVILPVVLAAMDFVVYRRRPRYLPLVFLFVLALVVGLFTLQAETLGRSLTPGTLANPGQAMAGYGWLLFWPTDVGAIYTDWRGLRIELVAAGYSALVALASAGVYCLRRNPLVTFGVVWFLAGFVLVCGYPNVVGGVIVSDRYIYLPLAGLILTLLALLPGRGVWFAVLLIAPLGHLSHEEVPYWRDSRTLMYHSMERHGIDIYGAQALVMATSPQDGLRLLEDLLASPWARSPETVVALHYMMIHSYEAMGSTWQAIEKAKEIAKLPDGGTAFYRGLIADLARAYPSPEVTAAAARLLH